MVTACCYGNGAASLLSRLVLCGVGRRRRFIFSIIIIITAVIIIIISFDVVSVLGFAVCPSVRTLDAIRTR